MAKLDVLKERLPDHARDLRINLGVITGSTALTPAQAWGIAIASAATARNAELLAAVVADATPHVSPEVITAAHGAAAIMGMNNVYYRFLHYMGAGSEVEPSYAQMPARLRMQIIGKPGIDHVDFELQCLAASAIAGCESCVRSHENVVRDKGGTKEAIQDAVRIAAVMNAVAVTLDALPG
ncbi:MAG: carboxymuconolactone decarboxylase family protein [Deltaproteobacteria bacterium]|nr:carboxymuconolactone decarboxylase family protein [Deltaproteobacteria bacterium]